MPRAETMTLSDLLSEPTLSANARAFANYWANLRMTDLVPAIDAFDPTEVKDLLRHFVIHEIESTDSIRFRLAGSAEVQRYGKDVTGQNYLDFVAPERRTTAAAGFIAMTEFPCGMLAIIQSTSVTGSPLINEVLGFPMADSKGHISRLYFQSNMEPPAEYRNARTDWLRRHDIVSRRVFIDIGAGAPTDFID